MYRGYTEPPLAPAAPVAGRRKLPGMKSEDVEVRSVSAVSQSVESASDTMSNSVPTGSPALQS